jgi:uncharacterized protein with WD repeat
MLLSKQKETPQPPPGPFPSAIKQEDSSTSLLGFSKPTNTYKPDAFFVANGYTSGKQEPDNKMEAGNYTEDQINYANNIKLWRPPLRLNRATIAL